MWQGWGEERYIQGSVGTSEGKGTLGRLSHRRKDDIKMDLKK